MASYSPQLIPYQCISVAHLSTQSPFHSPTHHHKHFNFPSVVVWRRALLSVFTAHLLQTKTKMDPKALPTFSPSLPSGSEMWLALLQKSSNDKNHKDLSYTQRYPRFYGSSPHLFFTLIVFLLTCLIRELLWRTNCQKQTAERKTMT